MDSALIVSCSEKSAALLAEFLAKADIINITTVSNAGEARRLLIEQDFDLCIINTPLPDEFGESLALSIAEKGSGEAILIVKAELFDETSNRVEDYGVITISKPISKPLLWSALKLASATSKKIKAMKTRTRSWFKKLKIYA